MELTRDERLALLEAMSKQIKPQLEELKGEAKLELMGMCEQSGVDRRAIMVCGQKVGEIGITYTAAKPCIDYDHKEEALEYLFANGLAEIVPKKGWENQFAKSGNVVIDTETGEVCPFLYWDVSVPKSAAVRGCKPKDVIAAMQGKLTSVTLNGLLED